MAAVIKIEVTTSGGLDAVKKDVDDLGQHAKDSGGGFNALQEIATGAMRAVGEAITGFAMKGFDMLAGAVQDGIADAQRNAQIQAQTAQVIKSTGEAAGVTAQHVSDYASALSDAAGKSLFGDDQIQQSTNLLLTFTNIKGATLDAATAISVDMAQALGGAPKDAAIQLGKALNDPLKGITALTRVGVTFSEEQKAQIQAMQEAGDTAGAQAVILAELNKEFGGSAAAAAAATGGWSEFNGRLGEAKEALGTALLPLLNSFAGVLNDSVLPTIEDLAARVGPFVEGLQPIIAAAQAMIGGLIASFQNTAPLSGFTAASATLTTLWATQLQPALNEVWRVLQVQVMPILSDLATALFPLVGASVQVLAGFWTDILVPAIQLLWSILTNVVLPVIAALAAWLKDNLPGAIQATADFFTNTLFPVLNKVYTFLQQNVIPILQVVAQWLIQNVPVAIQKATDFWNNVLWPALNKIWLFIQDQVIPIIVQLVNETFTALNSAVQQVATYWTETLEPALRAVWEFIDKYINPILRLLADVVIAAVRVEVAALAALWNTVLLPAITAVYNFLNDKIIPIFKDLVNTYIANLKKGFNDLSDFFNNTFLPKITAVYNFIYNYLAPILATMGSDTGLLANISRWFTSIGDAISSVIDWLNALAKKWEEMKPPDWVTGHSPPPMADWFNWIAEGVRNVTAALPDMQVGLATMEGPNGNVSSSSVSNSRTFTYAPTIQTSGHVSAPMDLALASSLAGV